MVGIGGLRKVGLMAGEARSRHGFEAAVCTIFVASIAIHSGVSARQWKAIVVILDVFICDLPSAYGVALFAICAQLATVNVSMAVLATLADVGEDHFYVALGTGDGRMHAAKRVAGLIVVEFRNRANRFPGTRRVAVLTRYSQISVGTVCAPRSLCSRTFHKDEKYKS